jgi:hypothetical protein
MARLLMWRQKRTDDPLANDALKRKIGPFASSQPPSHRGAAARYRLILRPDLALA